MGYLAPKNPSNTSYGSIMHCALNSEPNTHGGCRVNYTSFHVLFVLVSRVKWELLRFHTRQLILWKARADFLESAKSADRVKYNALCEFYTC